jgi:UDP:flavonoid glycosyltransferase YjiC (YdhE family)
MSTHRFACFITPHGFGHATRAAAVMAAIRALGPATHFEIFTRVPRWLFEQSIDAPFGYHSVLTDIGLAQKNALHEDIGETLRRLDHFLPFDPAQVQGLAQQVTSLGCDLVLCDVAPLGIAVARAAGVPSVLIENFTWDWIYEGYVGSEPGLARHIAYLCELYAQADYRIQTEPVCRYMQADLLTAPVSRAPRLPASQLRAQLGILAYTPLVLVTMGGLSMSDQHAFLHQLAEQPDTYFVIPGASEHLAAVGNIVSLPYQSSIYHPDLMRAADAVVGKTGYSTVAEAYHAGVPYGYVSRPKFPESAVMAAYIQKHMHGIEFSEPEFHSGAWLDRLPDLLALRRIERDGPNGADQVAQRVLEI